jgi:high-affinity K+ transport system ATPase subunit B
MTAATVTAVLFAAALIVALIALALLVRQLREWGK